MCIRFRTAFATCATNSPVGMPSRINTAAGYFLGGALIDYILEPFMAAQGASSLLGRAIGVGEGSGAALLFLLLGFAGIAICLLFRRDSNIWSLETIDEQHK